MKVSIYICKYQLDIWYLPPYICETMGCFLDKSQAISFVRDWVKKYREESPGMLKGLFIQIDKQTETPEGLKFVTILDTQDGITFRKVRRKV